MRKSTWRRLNTWLHGVLTNNMAINTRETKERIVDFRKPRGCRHSPTQITGTKMEHVCSSSQLLHPATIDVVSCSVSDLDWEVKIAPYITNPQFAAPRTTPSHRLFTLLPSGRRYRSLRSHTSGLRNSFLPTAVPTELSAPPLIITQSHPLL